MSATASGADKSGGSSSTAQNRSHTPGNQTRSFTPDQKAAVIRVRKCSHTAFYEILAVEKSATDNEIKKAYRKLSLLTHPDKNGYDGADEAFKMVSRAFQVLSDAEKKAKFDRFGGDPDSRFGAGGGGGGGGAPSNPFEGFARRSTGGGRGPMFEEEISPEELFQRFFGGGGGFGGGGFGPFGGGEQLMFNMGGGNGFRVHQFGGQPRRRPRDANGQQQEQSPMAVLQNLLPLIILFAVTIFSSLFSGLGGESTPRVPNFTFSPSGAYTELRRMPSLKLNGAPVSFYVEPKVIDHLSRSDLKSMDRRVENQYIYTLNTECLREQRTQQRLMEDAQGWGIFPDQAKIAEIRGQKLQHCETMANLGLRVQYGY